MHQVLQAIDVIHQTSWSDLLVFKSIKTPYDPESLYMAGILSFQLKKKAQTSQNINLFCKAFKSQDSSIIKHFTKVFSDFLNMISLHC